MQLTRTTLLFHSHHGRNGRLQLSPFSPPNLKNGAHSTEHSNKIKLEEVMCVFVGKGAYMANDSFK